MALFISIVFTFTFMPSPTLNKITFSLAIKLIAYNAVSAFRANLDEEYIKHNVETIYDKFFDYQSLIKLKGEEIVVTVFNHPYVHELEPIYRNLSEKLKNKEINPNGDINANVFWQETEAPFVFRSNGTVADGYQLTLEEGVIVKFDDCRLDVYGRLEALGTGKMSIIFTSYKDDEHSGDSNGDGESTTPASGDWDYIRIRDGGTANFDYCEFYYGGASSTFDATLMVEGTNTVENSVQRLLGFYCEDEKIISDHSIENIAIKCGEEIRKYINNNANNLNPENNFIPRENIRKNKWPQEVRDGMKEFIENNETDQPLKGISHANWERIDYYLNNNDATDVEIIDLLNK